VGGNAGKKGRVISDSDSDGLASTTEKNFVDV
jgi:hypothetical protein